MEHSAQIGRWTVRFDPDLTASLYSRISPSECECTDCANFRAAGSRAFSAPFLFLLRQMGIDPSKPAALCHYGESGEAMPTSGWFHFVGHLDAGADAWKQSGPTTWHLDPEPFPGIKRIGFTSRISLASALFAEHSLVHGKPTTCAPGR